MRRSFKPEEAAGVARYLAIRSIRRRGYEVDLQEVSRPGQVSAMDSTYSSEGQRRFVHLASCSTGTWT